MANYWSVKSPVADLCNKCCCNDWYLKLGPIDLPVCPLSWNVHPLSNLAGPRQQPESCTYTVRWGGGVYLDHSQSILFSQALALMVHLVSAKFLIADDYRSHPSYSFPFSKSDDEVANERVEVRIHEHLFTSQT